MKPKSEKGFTLIELLVVISIIGLLSSIILASLNSARTKARNAKRLVEKRQVITALNSYYNENGKWPLALGTSGFWTCFGAPDAERCWFQTAYPSGQFAGLTSLVTAMQPYMSSFPINNAEVGTLGFNRLLYSDYFPADNGGGPGSPAGAYILWMQENTMTNVICPGYIFPYETNRWYCVEYLGPP